MAEEMQRNVEVGVRLKGLRRALRLTQPTVADGAGVTLRAYQAWESGASGIAWKHLDDLASTLKTSPEFILHGEEQPMDRANVGTQLDRIEEKLDEILKRLPEGRRDRAAAPDRKAQPPAVPRKPRTAKGEQSRGT